MYLSVTQSQVLFAELPEKVSPARYIYFHRNNKTSRSEEFHLSDSLMQGYPYLAWGTRYWEGVLDIRDGVPNRGWGTI